MNKSTSKNKHIALFGGKFDPPHLGHQLTVFLALEKFSMDEVWVIPTFSHPFGFQSSSYDLRFRMTEDMVLPWKNTGRVKVLGIEKEMGTKIVHTVDVIELLTKRHPDYSFHLFIGEDNWKIKDKWKDFSKIDELCDEVIVIGRGKSDYDLSLPDISSTEIRDMIKNGKDPSKFLPKGIWQLIKERKIYS